MSLRLSLDSLEIDTRNFPSLGRIHRFSPALDSLVDPAARVEVLAAGFAWTEGPVWVRESSTLLFSDIPRNTIFCWREGAGVTPFLSPSGFTGLLPYGREPGSNGLTLDPKGRLVACEHGDRRVSLLTRDGGKITLADHFGGKRLNSPNDCCFHPSGDLYFTDPPYGLPEQFNDPRRELDFCGVYRVSPSREISLLTAELSRPNGLAFSPDAKTLYVSNSDPDRAIWMAYPLTAEGQLGPGRLFADLTAEAATQKGLPDGFKLDLAGNLFATGPGGISIFSPTGERLGLIEVGEACANVAWGDDGSTLYICADMYLCRIPTRTHGRLL
jgi:gluconolactonase